MWRRIEIGRLHPLVSFHLVISAIQVHFKMLPWYRLIKLRFQALVKSNYVRCSIGLTVLLFHLYVVFRSIDRTQIQLIQYEIDGLALSDVHTLSIGFVICGCLIRTYVLHIKCAFIDRSKDQIHACCWPVFAYLTMIVGSFWCTVIRTFDHLRFRSRITDTRSTFTTSRTLGPHSNLYNTPNESIN